jgi:hypothetical protein
MSLLRRRPKREDPVIHEPSDEAKAYFELEASIKAFAGTIASEAISGVPFSISLIDLKFRLVKALSARSEEIYLMMKLGEEIISSPTERKLREALEDLILGKQNIYNLDDKEIERIANAFGPANGEAAKSIRSPDLFAFDNSGVLQQWVANKLDVKLEDFYSHHPQIPIKLPGIKADVKERLNEENLLWPDFLAEVPEARKYLNGYRHSYGYGVGYKSPGEISNERILAHIAFARIRAAIREAVWEVFDPIDERREEEKKAEAQARLELQKETAGAEWDALTTA